MGETIELPHGRVEIDVRPGYLHVVEQGTLTSVAEVEKYTNVIERAVLRTGLRRVLIDSRGTEPVGRDDGVREALWKWLLTGRAFEQMAFVLSSELQVTSVNMVALSERAPIRAFATVHEAHRWLAGRARTLSQALTSQGMPAATFTPPPARPDPHRRTPAPPRASDRPPPPRTSERPPPPRPESSPARSITRKTMELPVQRVPERGFESVRKSDVLPAFATESISPVPRKKADEP